MLIFATKASESLKIEAAYTPEDEEPLFVARDRANQLAWLRRSNRSLEDRYLTV